jgi:outer membrane protein W
MKKVLFIFALTALFFTASTPLRAQQMRVGVQIGAAIPVGGDWSDWVSTGIGGIGTFHYVLNQKVTLTGALGYYSFGSKNSLANTYLAVGDYSYSVMPIVVGLRYNMGKESESFQPYLGGEIGFFVKTWSFKVNLLGYSASSDYSATDFGFSPMAGFRFILNKDVDLDVNAKYSIVSDAGHLVFNFGAIFNI